MDFHSLSRRELQSLSKKNKIPANITNVAMADALAALPYVEGIEEFLNGERSEVPESPMREVSVNEENPRTALRTSTRRKTVKDEPVTTRTRRAAAAKCTDESESRDLNVALTTPSLTSGRRRTASASACKKVEFQMTDDVAEKEDQDLDLEKKVFEKTPAPKSQKKVAAASTRRRTETRNDGATEQRAYSTRRSVRLLETTMGSLSLGGEDKEMEPVTVDMSFDEMPNSSGSVKESTNLEVESKNTDESESNLDDNQEKNDLESEVKVSEVEQESDLDSFNSFAENIIAEKNSEALDNNMNVKCSLEVEEVNEAFKDDEVDLTVAEPIESICEPKDSEEESKITNISVEMSLPHEEETETQVDDVLSSDEESSIEVKVVDDLELEGESLDADIEDKKEMEMETVSVQAEEAIEDDDDDLTEIDDDDDDADIVDKEMEMETASVHAEEAIEDDDDDLTEEESNDIYESEDFDEESTIMKQPLEEETETQVNDVLSKVEESAIEVNEVDDLEFEEESLKADENVSEELVEASVTSKEELNTNGVQSIPSLASQFPRPIVEAKSPLKAQSIKLLIDNSDGEDEDEDEKEHEQANNVEKNDMSLRQLKKMFKEKLQLNKKKMDSNNTKVVGEGKVRTALQPLPENRMAIGDLEKKF